MQITLHLFTIIGRRQRDISMTAAAAASDGPADGDRLSWAGYSLYK